MNRNYRVLFVAPAGGWQPDTPHDVPAMFALCGGEPERCGLNTGIVQSERFNARAIAQGTVAAAWAILIRDRHNDGKAVQP